MLIDAMLFSLLFYATRCHAFHAFMPCCFTLPCAAIFSSRASLSLSMPLILLFSLAAR